MYTLYIYVIYTGYDSIGVVMTKYCDFEQKPEPLAKYAAFQV